MTTVAAPTAVTEYATELRGVPIWHVVPEENRLTTVLDGALVMVALCGELSHHFAGQPSPELELCPHCRHLSQLDFR